MTNLFLTVFNVGITASWICLAVVLLRVLLKKAPKALVCLLWAVVGLRLIFPISIESVLSLIPSAQTLPPEIIYTDIPVIDSGIPTINEVINPTLSQSMAPTPGDSVNPMQVLLAVASQLWVAGAVVMLGYMLISYLRIRLRVREATPVEKGVWICDRVDSPFILGILRPRIYLPSDLKEKDRAFVLAHERSHLRRCDHFWKPLGFLLLAVYWFHPLLWVAYVLLCRDIEFACDEKVLEALDDDAKRAYSVALVHCSIPKRQISACPVAFGETGVVGRVKRVMHYKKPGFWLILAAVVAVVITSVCFLTNPPTSEKPDEPIDPPTENDSTGPEQPTEPPATHAMIPPGGVPSEEFRAEMADAFMQSYGTAWTYRYAEGNATYYGAYDDYAVLFSADTVGRYGNFYFYCGNYKFSYPMNFMVVVYRNGEFYDLSDAYQSGIVTDARLKTIWETQNLTNGRYVETDQEPDVNSLPIEEILARIGTLSEEEIVAIKTAYLIPISAYYPLSDLTVSYYGKFNGSTAFIMDGPWHYADASYCEKIGGVIFSYPSSRQLCIYNEGHIYSLQWAYKIGLLTTEDLQILRENYIVVEHQN